MKRIQRVVGMIGVPRHSEKLCKNVSISLDGTAEEFGSSLRMVDRKKDQERLCV